LVLLSVAQICFHFKVLFDICFGLLEVWEGNNIWCIIEAIQAQMGMSGYFCDLENNLDDTAGRRPVF